ncbi:hypothetical protein JM47_03475 [Ureaplasma diversum]|uniref:Transmembrane protein n=2 Tax=Ureaplasma diversum TaxID=42094 RepID=A0A084EYF2_9BACT|nr:hypothetical protein [Ureaplasma diversum]AJQ45586.1 hypothetical protein JM47_03475 [Ureaplasma diversum]KEZ22994.1 hypothetical protein UDIV_4300 [Ureaplasma diversum NCTC 246]
MEHNKFEQQLDFYKNSLKTNEKVENIFENEQLKDKITKYRGIGLIACLVLFVIGFAILIGGAFVNKEKAVDQTILLNPPALAMVIVGLLFFLFILIPYFIIANKNEKVMQEFINNKFNQTILMNFFRYISSFINSLTLLRFEKKDDIYTFYFNYENQQLQLDLDQQKNQIALYDNDKKLIKMLDHEIKFDFDLFAFKKLAAGFAKNFIIDTIDFISVQIDNKAYTLLTAFNKLYTAPRD